MKTPMMTTKELSEAGVTRIVMPETKSDTPRTDRAVKDCYLGDGKLNPLIDFSKRLEIENQILRDGLQYVMSERNPLGFATDKQVAHHFIRKADDVAEPSNIPS